MKVVMFGNYALYFIPRIIAFSNRLKKNGDELWILQAKEINILYEGIPQVDTTGLNIVNIWDAPSNLNYTDKAYYMLDKINPDVLITGFISFPYGAAGLKWAKSRKKGIIEYDDQRLHTFPRNRFANWIKSRIIRNVDAFMCPAPAWDETLLAWGFKRSEIFYGLDTSDNDFWGTKVKSIHFENLPPSYFMTLGRQTAMKNLSFFLIAYKEYLSRGGNIPLVMVGEGPEHELLLKIAGGNTNIFFLNFQKREFIRELFVRMKALVLPSTKIETWGMVVNECMASGNIVAISEECGSATTLVLDNINGYHFNPNDKESIISALFKIERLNTIDEAKMHEASLNIIKEWGLDRFVEELYRACLYVLANKKPIYNILDKLLIYFWEGRYNVAKATR